MSIYRLAAACELGLLIWESASANSALPIGGGHIQQVGIVFGIAFIASEMWTYVSLAFRNLRREWTRR